MKQETPSMLDTVKMIRCVLKISSAFNDLDSIIYEKKYFKYNFKKEARKWLEVMESHTKSMMDGMNTENPEILDDLYKSFEESLLKVQLDKEEKEPLIRFYIKLKSCLNDIESMEEGKQRLAPIIIKLMTEPVVYWIEKQYIKIINTVDKNGMYVYELIDFLDNFGQSVAYLENDEHNDDGKNT
jgi:hypothetical protein